MTEVVERNGYDGSMSPQTREAEFDGRRFRRVQPSFVPDIQVDLAPAAHPVVDDTVSLPVEIVTPSLAEPQRRRAAVHGASDQQIDPQDRITRMLRELGISTPGFDMNAARRRLTKKRGARK